MLLPSCLTEQTRGLVDFHHSVSMVFGMSVIAVLAVIFIVADFNDPFKERQLS